MSSKPANSGSAGKNSKSYYYEEDDDQDSVVLNGSTVDRNPKPLIESVEKKNIDKEIKDERMTSDKKKARVIAERMRDEFEKMKKEGLSEWSEIINQISLAPEGEDDAVIKKAMGFFNVLQKQIEFNKRILKENLEIEKQMGSISQSDLVRWIPLIIFNFL